MKKTLTRALIGYALIVFCMLWMTSEYERRHADEYGKWEVVEEEPPPLVLEQNEPVVIHVTVTIYHPERRQTDSTPDIVASGKKINIRRASDHRWIAVSRDLLKRWGGPLRYGELVYIANAGDLSGYYRVEDTMNKRYTNRVDILRTPGAPLAKYENAELIMVGMRE